MKIPHAVKGALSGVAVLAVAGLVAACGSTTEATDSGASAAKTTAAAKAHKRQAPPKPKMTTSQRKAVESAKNYLETQAFSKKGLIQQLSSSAGERFPEADARFAVNHIDVDWDAQAVKSAKQYLGMQSFSRSALIEQLSSSAGEGFTLAQAQHAVARAYR